MKLSMIEMSKCLGVPLSTVERWIKQGRIPVYKSKNDCIFKKSTLENWSVNHNLSFVLPQDSMSQQQEPEMDTLVASMKRGGVMRQVKGETVKEVLKASVENIPDLTPDEKTILLERLLEREDLTSTGVGKGIAIPHPRSPLEDAAQIPVIATCFLESNVDYNAVDDVDVFVLFILLSPTVKQHLHLLSRLAYCVRDNSFVTFLKSHPDAGALFERVEECENRLDNTENY